MSWMKRLVETYDTYQDLAGVVKNDQPVLLPISHSERKVQIEIRIDEDGKFIEGAKVEKGNEDTIMPETMESDTCTGKKIVPKPLCGQLYYVAGDYFLYAETDKEKRERHEVYMSGLRKWINSPYKHSMIEAIYRYLEKKTLIHDLVKFGVLNLDSDGKIEKDDEKKYIRFIVETNEVQFLENRVWKRKDVYDSYINYYKSCLHKTDVCYISGMVDTYVTNHPYVLGSSKLICTNGENLVYLGRFADKRQALSVGYESSQKAHKALKWLIAKQGYQKKEFTFISWIANRDAVLPDITKNSVHAYDKLILGDGEKWYDFLTATSDTNPYDTGKQNAKKLIKAIQGHGGQIEIKDHVVLMILETPAKGRAAITFYDEIDGKQYINALQNWYSHCIWQHYVVHETAGRWLESTPSPREIALACYGVMRDDKLDMDSKLMKSVIKKILPCITKNKEIPNDMIKSACRNTSRPLAFYHKNYGFFIWENQMLYVTCALIRYRYEKQKGDQAMATFLEDNTEDRNVLFGRLLAILEYMEERAMFEKDEHGKVVTTRQTNAKRYWAAYSRRPAATFKILYENLMPYRNKLSSYEERCFEKWVQEVMDCLLENGYDNHALTENYLPSYYMQMKEMKEYFFSNKKQVESKGE